MTGRLTTDAELAEKFEIGVDRLHMLRRQHGWPHVRLSRYDIRFTDEQVEQIIASCSVAPSKAVQGMAAGLTARSARRRSA